MPPSVFAQNGEDASCTSIAMCRNKVNLAAKLSNELRPLPSIGNDEH